ncbi:MAG: glutaredoxin domain-containing protein [Bacteroidota bacterium]
MMEIKDIRSFEELTENLGIKKRTFLLLYKSGSEKSVCAYENLKKAASLTEEDVNVLTADVKQVRDIHTRYGIQTAPALLEFEGSSYRKSVKGCHNIDFYISLLKNTLFVSRHNEEQSQKRVVVYSTPSCPHCTNLKNYLRNNQIHFRDIDVSKDQKVAQELVKKSGQQGVPQTEINGRIIVGFNKQKIDELLEI